MPMTIGGQSLAIARPANLDDVLTNSTGCSMAELAAQLHRGGTAFQVARALQPMLKEPVGVGDLAASISDDELVAVRLQVAAMLADKAGVDLAEQVAQ